MISTVDLAAKIKKLSDSKGVSVKRVLENCNINRNFIYDLEHSLSSPSIDKINNLAIYFDVSVDYLIGKTNYQKVIEKGDSSILKKWKLLSESEKSEALFFINNLILKSTDDDVEISAESGTVYDKNK